MNFIKKRRLSRRTFLRGASGVALSLPVLDIMLNDHGDAFAQDNTSFSKRYAIVLAGSGLAWDSAGNRNHPALDQHFIQPKTVGRNYEITTPLTPLAGLREHFSLVSNLYIPTGGDSGAYPDFHCGAKSPLLSGVNMDSSSARRCGKTSDQVVADFYAQKTPEHSLVYRAQPNFYHESVGPAGREFMSYSDTNRPVPAISSPQIAFGSLFGNFSPKGAASGAQVFEHDQRVFMLDLVRQSAKKLAPCLGVRDCQRLDRHFQEIQELSERVSRLPPEAQGACRAPQNPGEDPPAQSKTSNGYSGEDERARVFADLIHMAFACDLSRSATLMLTMFQSHMRMEPLGLPYELHGIGHGDSKGTFTHDGVEVKAHSHQAVSLCLQWHVKHYAYLVQKLLDTPEGSGTLLDNSAIVFMPEAGFGKDVNGSASEGQTTHSTERMVLGVAGHAGGLAGGLHIHDGAQGDKRRHPAQVLVSCMQAVGLEETTSLGHVTGTIPELFG